MARINLNEEELKLLGECINEQKDVPPELLTKLSPGFFEELAAIDEINPDLPEYFQDSIAQFYTFDLLRPEIYSAWFNNFKRGIL